jgi:hypothetical protein
MYCSGYGFNKKFTKGNLFEAKMQNDNTGIFHPIELHLQFAKIKIQHVGYLSA